MLECQLPQHLDKETRVTTVGPFTKDWIQSSPGRWRKRYDKLRPYWRDFKTSHLGRRKKTDLDLINKETLLKFRADFSHEESLEEESPSTSESTSESASTNTSSAEASMAFTEEQERPRSTILLRSDVNDLVAAGAMTSFSKRKAKRTPTLRNMLQSSDRVLTQLSPINVSPASPPQHSILVKNNLGHTKPRLTKKVVMFNNNIKSHLNRQHEEPDDTATDIDINTFVNSNAAASSVSFSPRTITSQNFRSMEMESTRNFSTGKETASSGIESFVTAPDYPDSTHPEGVDHDPWSSDEEDQTTDGPANPPSQKLRSILSRSSLQPRLLEENRSVVAESVKHKKSMSSMKPPVPQIRVMDRNLKKLLDDKQTGEILAAEKMLVMLKGTKLKYVSHQFNETENIETKVLQKWKEYIVVARNTGNPHAPILLQFYENRNIPRIQEDITKTVSKLDTVLNKNTYVKFYSTLDKTIVFWRGSETGTLLYILRPRSHQLSLRWLSLFLRTLGAKKAANLPIGIPELGYSIEIKLPITMIQEEQDRLESERSMNKMASYHEIKSVSNQASPVLKYVYAVTIKLLKNVGYTKEDLRKFLGGRKYGLAWRHYDRIEWMDESNEEGIYYNWVLVDAYELEIRAKQYFAQNVIFEDGTTMEEPTPIEGFLVRLTTWKGKIKRYKGHLHELFFKPLFFHTHNQFLFFSKTKNVIPGNPVGYEFENFLDEGDEAKVARAPLIYEVQPFQTDSNGDIVWLKEQDSSYTARRYDENGFYEVQRRKLLLVNSNGFIDLCEVQKIQSFSQPIIPFTTFKTTGSHIHPVHKEQIIEIVMDSGPTILLQAFNKETRDLWIERLTQLSKYWKRRIFETTARINEVREHNLTQLNVSIDSGIDTFLGSRGNKWESTSLESVADEHLFCKTSRSITIQGRLFQKPKKFASFRQYQAILCNGRLLLYSLTNSLYNKSVCQTLLMTVDLTNSSTYVYSGPVTELDLLQGRDRSFDSQNPGTHYIPRVYSDGWRSVEPEEHRCFVLWFGRKKPLKTKSAKFKRGVNVGELNDGNYGGGGKNKSNGIDLDIKLVNRLGVVGVSMVFLARSRQERDLWVLALNTEIERIAESATSDINLN
jgi:hypothetical protein